MNFIWLPRHTGATPDGRLAGEETSKNCSPTIGMDTEGATALVNTLGSLDPADFEAFWAKGVADLAAIPLDARMTEEPRKSSAKWTMYRVSFAGCDQPPNGDPNRVRLRLSVFPYELSLDKAANRRKFDELNAGYKAKYGVPRYPFAGMDVSPRDYFYFPVILGAVRAVRRRPVTTDEMERTGGLRFSSTPCKSQYECCDLHGTSYV